MNDVLRLLMDLAGINYQTQRWVELIAKAKASNMDEDAKNEIIGVAQKAMDAETERNAAVATLLEKYGKAENIEAQTDDDDEDYFG